jgi:hypothetical protein
MSFPICIEVPDKAKELELAAVGQVVTGKRADVFHAVFEIPPPACADFWVSQTFFACSPGCCRKRSVACGAEDLHEHKPLMTRGRMRGPDSKFDAIQFEMEALHDPIGIHLRWLAHAAILSADEKSSIIIYQAAWIGNRKRVPCAIRTDAGFPR